MDLFRHIDRFHANYVRTVLDMATIQKEGESKIEH